MKKRKLNLKDLSVKSFTTDGAVGAKGGSSQYPTQTTVPPTGHMGNCNDDTEPHYMCAYNSNGLRTYCTGTGGGGIGDDPFIIG